MSLQCEILDTIDTPGEDLYFDQCFVNSEGAVFMMHYLSDKIYLFNPEGGNQLEVIQEFYTDADEEDED